MGIKTNFFPVNRALQNHWLWQEKPFSKGQAWIDLLMLASYEDGERVFRGKVVPYKAGEVHCSKLYLADRWGWERKKVDRFLKLLSQEKMITENATTHGTTITVENYTKFNHEWTTNDAPDGQPMGIIKKLKKLKNNKKECVYARAHGKFSNVFLSDAEYEQFTADYENAAEIIERLSNYKKRKGKDDDNEADYAWLESFPRTDGKKKAERKSRYEQYLAEAKLGYPPPDNAGLTKAEFEELRKIAEVANE